MNQPNNNLQPIEDLLADLADTVSDDLNAIAEVGTLPFSTPQLKRLLVRWQARYHHLQRIHRLFLWSMGASPVWLFAGLGLLWLRTGAVAAAVLLLFPLSMTAGVLGMVYLSYRYGGMNYQRFIGEQIQKTLRQRANRQKL